MERRRHREAPCCCYCNNVATRNSQHTSYPSNFNPLPTQKKLMMDTPMAEAPDSKSASTTDKQLAATAGSADQAPQRRNPQHAAAEQAPPMTEFPPASTFPREHPPREPASRQPTSRLYDSPPDRKPSHFSTYPTASDSLPQTPYMGMSAPSNLRAHTGTSSDRIPHLASYPTAPRSASQTPQPGTSQQGVSAAGWLVPPPTNTTSKITFEGTFDDSSPPF